MAHAVIGKWDDDLAIPIPQEIVDQAGLLDGEEVDLEATEYGLIIRRCQTFQGS